MGKRNKSKRFFQQSKDVVSKHDERFPYHTTLAEAEERRANQSISSQAGEI
ncbi:hypothetical protein [Metabacillus malikii]|uniref:Competence protein n=1 Tax=Metabacillus malikii TaxID=1504265 RepID=A0ABT9ZK70_9BACI|nr:hypothetical protein [Metabacillus malikii]MDQ0232279.1 hypothetical protein [Metabacillus malikii]